MAKEIVRIQAAILDKVELTLYTVEGIKIVIPQGDPRVRKIIDIAVPALASNPTVEIDISTEEENHYADFEKQSSGVVKFFKVAKSKLRSLFGLKPEEPVEPQSAGTIPMEDDRKGLPMAINVPTMPAVSTPTTDRTTMDVMNEIMAHATPVAHASFNERGVHKQGDVVNDEGQTDKTPTESTEPNTIIAVVDGKVVPGVELIKTQIARASKWGSTVGVENFLRRLTAVIDKRKHSVDDLLKFLERADLPIADDGSILIYKVLRRSTSKKGEYVDCHTKLVPQWIGAYVCMDPSLVDHNRRNECSNGLHVARRGYVSGFSGDVCVLAKLAPEDVIAVPEYDANKMRVCGYHILAELSDKQYSLLRNNRPITEDEAGKQLLAFAMAGQHVRMTHEVRITKQSGQGVVTKVLGPNQPVMLASGIVAPGFALENKIAKVESSPAPVAVEALPDKAEQVVAVAPEKLQDVIAKVDTEKQLAKTGRQAQAAALYNKYKAGEEGALEALRAFKKAAKVNWDKLGITDPDVIGDQTKPVKKVAFVDKTTAPVPSPFKDKPAKAAKRSRDVTAINREGSPRERIANLLAIGLNSVNIAQSILTIKKQSKKSWDVLGVTPKQVIEINKLLGK